MTSDLAFLDEQRAQRLGRGPALVRVQDARGLAHRDRRLGHGSPPQLILCLIEARFPSGTHETYQVPLGSRPPTSSGGDGDLRGRRPGRLRRAARTRRPAASCCTAMRADRDAGDFAFRWTTEARRRTSVDVRPVGVEQSNTSIVFGDELIMKAIRRIEPGVNPELELLRFLTARGFPHIAALDGWYEVDGRHVTATLGILQEFLAGARDGWELTLDELATDPEGLLDRVEALGVVIGELHTALGSDNSDPDFAPVEPSARVAVDPLRRRRRADRARLPRPARHRGHRADPGPRPGRAREALAALARDRRRARDPHPRRPAPRPDDAVLARLGGAGLRGRAGAAAARAAPEALAAARRGRHAALLLLRDRGREAAARAPRRRTAGRSARASASWPGITGPWTTACCHPGQQATEQLLAVFELEKAVYELRYELNNRPDWVAIPVAGILRLLDSE